MTDNTQELDEILWYVYEAGAKSMEDSGGSDYEVNEAKSALISLIKELVAEAQPKRHNTYVGDAYQRTFCEEYNKGIDQFEQNLLKALEEK